MSTGANSGKVLLVEGSNDEHVVRHIWKSRHNSSQSFEILDKQGYNTLLDSITTELVAIERETVGILIDANDGGCAIVSWSLWSFWGYKIVFFGLTVSF